VRLALAALGPGWTLWMKLVLIDKVSWLARTTVPLFLCRRRLAASPFAEPDHFRPGVLMA
jgi:hypothetical protein